MKKNGSNTTAKEKPIKELKEKNKGKKEKKKCLYYVIVLAFRVAKNLSARTQKASCLLIDLRFTNRKLI